jgi:serine/threonine-protein kinase
VEPNKADALAKTIRLDERLQQRRAEKSAPAASAQGPGPGSMLGNYLIVNQIGEGGMGMVYKARDMVLDRTVALKILPPHLTQNPEFLHRIRTEAHAQARLHHPNIVTLYSVQELPAGFMLVMEYIEGQTLHQRIHDQGPLDPAEAARVFDQALQGIAYAHAMGIVHRDLKPDNIFLTHKGEVKIMDFGVAKIVDNKEPTCSRSLVGTLLYISPEQINGRDADFRSDIYTLGISLFEAVTGRLPFERKSDYALMHAHVLENPPSPRNLKRDLPRELEGVILKAIEKDPGRRHQSAGEFREMLLRLSARYGLEAPSGVPRTASRIGERLAAYNRILGGLRFDIILMLTIAVLALALGLHPGQERPVDDVEPVTRLDAPPSATPVPVRKPAGGIQESGPPSRGQPAHDRYESLRKAWGG